MTDVIEIFDYWRERCDHPNAKLTGDRRQKVQARLAEGYTVAEIRQAIDGAAAHPFVASNGHRFDDLELICRKGSKLEDFIARTTLPPVAPVERAQALNRADGWKAGYA